jgi:hypothetical protein
MTEAKEHRSKERRFDRSEFGKCLYDLMLSRDLVTATDLAQAMERNGKGPSDRLIRQYWSGTSKPSVSFMRDVAEALQLTHEEKARLSMSIYYGDEWRKLKG